MSDSKLDIANAEAWFGFRPGMALDEVRAKMEELGLEETELRDDYFSAATDDVELEFWFERAGSKRVRQIAADGDVSWKGRPVVGRPIDDALRAMEPLGTGPMWDTADATNDPFPAAGGGAVFHESLSGERLLEESTIWLPERGLGLVVCDATVLAVAWRQTRDLPHQFAGPVTAEQRQLSKRPDLEEHLRASRLARQRAAVPKDPRSVLRVLLGLICAGLFVWIGRNGFQEMQRWNTAPTLTGKFVAMEQAPRKRFFDLGPEFVRQRMPDDPVRRRDMYRIEYRDPAGHTQTAMLEHADFYVPPREPGEEVQIACVDGDPPRVKGLSRAHDAAFLECFPQAIAVGVLLVFGRMVIALLPNLGGLVTRLARTRDKVVDPDHPELR